MTVFLKSLEKDFESFSSEDNRLKKNREKAYRHFLSLGLPHAKTESYRYLRLHPLFAKPFLPFEGTPSLTKDKISSFILPESHLSYLVIINGKYTPSLSCLDGVKELSILPFSEAIKTYGALFHNQWQEALKEEEDPFASMNASFHQEGLFFYLPPKTALSSPLQILHFLNGKNEKERGTYRQHFFIGMESSLQFSTHIHNLDLKEKFFNLVTDIEIEDRANVRFHEMESNASSLWHFSALRSRLKKQSSLKGSYSSKGGKAIRRDAKVSLQEPESSVHLSGLTVLSKESESHTHILIDHKAPYCHSYQLFKTLAYDEAKASFEGKILVQKEADKTEAFQLSRNLLIGEKAKIFVKPNLKIFASDVKASHGATIGNLNQEEVHYLRSKGIPYETCCKLLLKGFSKEIIDLLFLDSLKENVLTYFFDS